MKELKLALLGFGNAGRAFGRLLMDKHDEIKTGLICKSLDVIEKPLEIYSCAGLAYLR